MTRLKIAALLIGIVTPMIGVSAGALIWKGTIDAQIQQMLKQQDDMQKSVNWLIRHQPDGEQYLQQHKKSAIDEFDMNRPPENPKDAGSPIAPHY